MTILFWTVRVCLGFSVLALLPLSWRASLVLATSAFFEFFNVVLAVAPGAAFWGNCQMLLGVGLILGAVVSWGRSRPSTYWHMPLLALCSNLLLTVSWGTALLEYEQVWVSFTASTLSLPAGCLCAAAAVDTFRSETRRFRRPDC